MNYYHSPEYLAWCLERNLDPNSQAVFESYVFREVAE
jgi:hypothetical protein